MGSTVTGSFSFWFKEHNHGGHTSLVALICSFVLPFRVNLDILISSSSNHWSITHFYKWHVSDWSSEVSVMLPERVLVFLHSWTNQFRIPDRSSVTMWLSIQYFEECMFVFRSAMWNHITMVKCKHNLSITSFSVASGPCEISEPNFFSTGPENELNLHVSIARLKL